MRELQQERVQLRRPRYFGGGGTLWSDRQAVASATVGRNCVSETLAAKRIATAPRLGTDPRGT